MKQLITVFVILSSFSIRHAALGQGALTPPGAPSPTMKTLQQIEPRLPVDAARTPGDASSLFIINQPGSYYLTNNVTGVTGKHGITITASDVTLDLMGFELVGAAGSLRGVQALSAITNLAVRHGTIRGWGQDGLTTTGARNVQLDDLLLAGNAGYGIQASAATTVRFCAAYANGSRGISVGSGSTVINCLVHTNTTDGVVTFSGGVVVGCAAQGNGANGILVGVESTVRDCAVQSNAGDGINAGNGSTITDCAAGLNTGDGIEVGHDCRLANNNCDNNGNNGDGAGIHSTGSDNRIDSNNVTDNDRGIDVDAAGNLIIRNSASGNTTNYDIAAGNKDAQVLSPGSAFISTDPWANFSY